MAHAREESKKKISKDNQIIIKNCTVENTIVPSNEPCTLNNSNENSELQ